MGACLAVVPNAHGEGCVGTVFAACALPGGAATGSVGGAVQRWKWDEGATALTPDGAALQLEGDGVDEVISLAVVSWPDGALQMLAGCSDRTLRVLGSGAGGELQLQAELAGHSNAVSAVAVMMP